MPKFAPLTRGIFREGDQALYADFVQDCEAKRRWHRVHRRFVGKKVTRFRRSHPAILFRRLARL